jgi:hypothetical protein
MTDMRSRSRSGILVGLVAAAGAFGAAAMMLAATAPTARADDVTDVINAVEGDYAIGQGDFTAALADFGSSDVNDGLSAFFSGVDTDLVGVPTTLELGTIDLLTNQSAYLGSSFSVGPEPDFTSGLAGAESALGAAQESFTSAAADLSSGDYVDAASLDAIGSFYDVAALQVLLEGAVASL